jgi:hypothetical protein
VNEVRPQGISFLSKKDHEIIYIKPVNSHLKDHALLIGKLYLFFLIQRTKIFKLEEHCILDGLFHEALLCCLPLCTVQKLIGNLGIKNFLELSRGYVATGELAIRALVHIIFNYGNLKLYTCFLFISTQLYHLK